jgi:hypothetical protein
MTTSTPSSLFPIGQFVMTPGVLNQIPVEFVLDCLRRHRSGDWGDLSAEDRKANDDGLRTRDRLLSSYKWDENHTLWLLTEADRSATTALLPAEYLKPV